MFWQYGWHGFWRYVLIGLLAITFWVLPTHSVLANQAPIASSTGTLSSQSSKNPIYNQILNSPVIDEVQVLSADEIDHLNKQLLKIYQDNLAQVAVVIVPSTHGEPIFDYTLKTARKWGLGREDVDNGVLILVAIHDKNLFITTGYGVEGVLPDAFLKRVIREDITPSFQNQQYAQGLSAGIARIDERLRTDPEILAQADKAQDTQTAHQEQADLSEFLIPSLIMGFFLSKILNRFFGIGLTALGFILFGLAMGESVIVIIISSLFLVALLWAFTAKNSQLPAHASRRNSSIGGSFGGSHRNGGFKGGGGFGSGGFKGGGGGFGGGGAGGSW